MRPRLSRLLPLLLLAGAAGVAAAPPAAARPDVRLVATHLVADTCRAGGPASSNRLGDPGERMLVRLEVRNAGTQTAVGVAAIVTVRSGDVTLHQGETAFPDLAPGATALATGDVEYEIGGGAACGAAFSFDVLLRWDGGGLRIERWDDAVADPCFACQVDACDPRYLIPWSTGPHGIEPLDVVAGFQVPTLEGGFDLEAGWSGCDGLVLVVRHPGWNYSTTLWNSSVAQLLERSPDNAHYLFLSASRDGAQVLADVQGMKDRVEAALAAMTPARRDHWQPRLHHVTTGALDLGNWLSDLVAARAPTAFAIDAFQRLRQAGLLFFLGGPQSPEMFLLTHELRLFNFEKERERWLAHETFLDVEVWRRQLMASGSTFVDLPDRETLAGFDTLLVELRHDCTDPWNPQSCEWDYLANLYLCEADDPDRCPIELARWITPYGRGGRWITDISPHLAFLRDGGRRRFVFSTPQAYHTDVVLKFANRGKGERPYRAEFLYSGGAFNEAYNDLRPPRAFTVPAWASRVEVAALVTGHGWGAEVENCAEFCNHQHVFRVGGAESWREHGVAGTAFGCVDQIEDGTVPNGFGTWQYGRGGWCAGLDVRPWISDFTAAVVPGTNEISYQGLFRGAPYVPQPSGSGQGFGARIDLSSWAISYLPMPDGPCGDDPGDPTLVPCSHPGCALEPQCGEADADQDGVPNADDCDPLDPDVGRVPADDLVRLHVAKVGPGLDRNVRLHWSQALADLGSGTRFDVALGALDELWAARDLPATTCLAREAAGAALEHLTDPDPPGGGRFYLLRAANRCGRSGFGREAVETSTCND